MSRPAAGRVVFLPADLDRRFGRDNLPDHGNLLTNLGRMGGVKKTSRWRLKDGARWIKLFPYRQSNRPDLALGEPDELPHLPATH